MIGCAVAGELEIIFHHCLSESLLGGRQCDGSQGFVQTYTSHVARETTRMCIIKDGIILLVSYLNTPLFLSELEGLRIPEI